MTSSKKSLNLCSVETSNKLIHLLAKIMLYLSKTMSQMTKISQTFNHVYLQCLILLQTTNLLTSLTLTKVMNTVNSFTILTKTLTTKILGFNVINQTVLIKRATWIKHQQIYSSSSS